MSGTAAVIFQLHTSAPDPLGGSSPSALDQLALRCGSPTSPGLFSEQEPPPHVWTNSGVQSGVRFSVGFCVLHESSSSLQRRSWSSISNHKRTTLQMGVGKSSHGWITFLNEPSKQEGRRGPVPQEKSSRWGEAQDPSDTCTSISTGAERA